MEIKRIKKLSFKINVARPVIFIDEPINDLEELRHMQNTLSELIIRARATGWRIRPAIIIDKLNGKKK